MNGNFDMGYVDWITLVFVVSFAVVWLYYGFMRLAGVPKRKCVFATIIVWNICMVLSIVAKCMISG